ncbi:thioesterase domain-containing protein [Methylobacterium sp. 77]|uniref:thioesterase domain-containing protein n=1 Tax=Methylobacterium sp. 77 TaxID=1101192 RepID=UPI0003810688|nr:thioesterase domain-containing protein [Methylobacterium sp. 77]
MTDDVQKELARHRRLEKLRFWRYACAAEGTVVTRYIGAPGSSFAPDAAPLHFFHGDWDNGGLYMARLAAELGFPVIGIAPHLEPVPATVHEMATDRVQHLLVAQPDGPYRLGGFCNGAMVAYEAARLLIQSGRDVELVALVAPPSLNAGRAFRRLFAITDRALGPSSPGSSPMRQYRVGTAMTRLTALRRVMGFSLHEMRVVLDRKRRLRTARKMRLVADAAVPAAARAQELAISEKHLSLTSAYERALYSYIPPSLPVRIVVLGTGVDAAGRRGENYDAAYDGRSWAKLCPDVTYVPVPGNHYTCIADHAPELAHALSDAFHFPRTSHHQRIEISSEIPCRTASSGTGTIVLSSATPERGDQRHASLPSPL